MQIERKSSIEKEPRTLTLNQIQSAREAALHVMKNNSIEEAIRIFTEGLKPVVGVSCQEKMMTVESDEESESVEARLRLPSLCRDVVTAPF